MKPSTIEGLLLKHEALRLKPYKDTRGKLTIGVGRDLEDVGITEEEALHLMENDIARCRQEAAKNFPWFNLLSVNRQNVVLSMIFNLGLGGFLKFKGMIDALDVGDFQRAGDEMMSSLWANQVGQRASELAELMVDP